MYNLVTAAKRYVVLPLHFPSLHIVLNLLLHPSRDLPLLHVDPPTNVQARCKRVNEGGSSNVRAVRAGGWRASYLNKEEFG